MPKDKINLLISSLVNKDSSLGNIGYYWGKYFENNPDYDTWIEPWAESKLPDGLFDNIRLGKKANTTRPYDVMLRKSDPHSCFHPFKPEGMKCISYIYYDAKTISPLIVEKINTYVDVLVVPSKFTYERFKNFGVTVPIKVVPLAVNSSDFRIIARPRNKKFTVINYGEQGLRKGTDLLITAFQEEFEETENVELRILVGNTNPNEKGISTLPSHIKKIVGRKPLEELVKEINNADCFCALTREDSFGMCGLESMACGLPVIASEKSGYLEYVNNNNGYLVPCDSVEHPRFEYVPNLEKAKQILRRAYEDWQKIEEGGVWDNKAMAAISTAHKLSWEAFGDRFDKIIKSQKN